jgi:hypothetical protein
VWKGVRADGNGSAKSQHLEAYRCLDFGFDAGVSALITLEKKDCNSNFCLCNKDGSKLQCDKKLAIAMDNFNIFFSEYIDILNTFNELKPLNHYATVVSSGATSDAYKIASQIKAQNSMNNYIFKVITTGVIRKFNNLYEIKPQKIDKSTILNPKISKNDLLKINKLRYDISNQPKIFVSGKRYLDAFIDLECEYASYHSVPIILYKNVSLKALVAIINSTISFFFINECFSNLAIDGGISFNWEIISKIPIPKLSQKDIKSLESLTDKFIGKCFLKDNLIELDKTVCSIYFKNSNMKNEYTKTIIDYGQQYFRKK